VVFRSGLPRVRENESQIPQASRVGFSGSDARAAMKIASSRLAATRS